MYGEIIGKPESILRYEVELINGRVKQFDYRNINQLFKIMTKIDSTTKRPNVIIETDTKNISCGDQVEHPLFYYDSIIRNHNKRIPPIKVVKNTTDEPMFIKLHYKEDEDFNIEINPGTTGILYDQYLCVYDNNTHRKMTEYHVIRDGLFILKDDSADYIFQDKLITSNFMSICMQEYYDPMIPILHIPSVTKLPLKITFDLIYEKQESYILYDRYGLVNKINLDKADYQLFYNEYEYNGYNVNESVHRLLFDNFDYNNHGFSGKAIMESYKTNVDKNTAELIQLVYTDVEEIKGSKNRDYSLLDFDTLVDKYFNY